jgi:hypothetical protein
MISIKRRALNEKATKPLTFDREMNRVFFLLINDFMPHLKKRITSAIKYIIVEKNSARKTANDKLMKILINCEALA